jgi:CO/xanthine dehydrogenase Mo-binding subunit
MTSVVGERILRYDGIAHVTGRTVYIDDLTFPGMLYTAALISPYPNARIVSIDTSKAEAMAGVAAVVTAKDVPNNRYGLIPDQPVFAEDYVRYFGQPIGAVAAVDEDTAKEAVEQIKIEYEVLEPIFDPLKAMEPDAPIIHDGGNTFKYGGRYACRQIRLGDIEQGFAEADEIVEGTYTTQALEHAQLETQVGVAVPDPQGRLTVYTVSQAVFFHAGQVAGILKMPLNKIRFIGGTVGGGFGGKNDLHTEHVISLLALKARKPVKWFWPRELEFLISTDRNPWRMEFKDGVKKDGRIVARKVRTIQDTGAYNLLGPMCMDKHCIMIRGPYTIPNVWVDGYVAYTNKQPTSSMRGFGVTQASFGHEVQMDKIAEAIGMDPWKLRLINAQQTGDIGATRQVLDSVSLIETMEAATKAAGMTLPPVGEARR